MGWRIITDEATQTAALISDDPLYALGPVIEADSANEAFEAVAAFAEACDPAPDQQPTIRLMAEWQSYVQYLAELQQQALSAAVAPDEDRIHPRAPDGYELPPEAVGGPEDASGPDPTSVGSNGQAELAASTLAGLSGAPKSDAEPAPIEGQQQVCWCCGGSGKLNLAGTQTDCNVCQGSGLVEAVAR